MNFLGKLLVFSIIVLLGSIYIYNKIESHDDVICYTFIKAMDTALLLDSVFQYVNLPGFYRGYEERLSNYIFSKVDRSGLNIERKEFDGVEVFSFDPVKHGIKRPAILFIHGGGWTFFNPKLYSHMMAEIALRLNLLVVSVNYRRAPEHPFPIPANDAVAAAKYFLKNAETFDVDPNRIALMGDSAGGNLVVVVSYQLALLRKTDKNARVPKVVLPLVGAFQMADNMLPTMRMADRDLLLSRKAIYWCYCTYAFGPLSNSDIESCMTAVSTNNHLSEEAVEKVKDNIDWKKYLKGSEYDKIPKSTFKFTPNKFMKTFSELVLNPLFSPLSALNNTELSRLPPIYLVVAGLDPLLDESRFFAARLSEVGRLGGYKEYDHYHDSFLLAPFGSEKSQNSLNDILEFFERKNIL